MAKPESASGSLEDILASIRKSLAEQSTDVLTQDASVPEAEARSAPRKEGLVGRLANATAGLAPHEEPATSEDDLSDLLVAAAPAKAAVPEPEAAPEPAVPEPAAPVIEPPAPVLPAPAPAVQADSWAPEPAQQSDPLWFLARSVEAGAPREPAQPALTRPQEVRATMPPFFGSSPETVRVEAPPASGMPPSSRTLFGAAPGPAVADPAMQREVSLVAAAAATAARPGAAPAANGAFPPAASPLQGSQALEAMVLDLLKPMLRQWLDQNMPRMVAEALKAEADRVGADGNGNKP